MIKVLMHLFKSSARILAAFLWSRFHLSGFTQAALPDGKTVRAKGCGKGIRKA